MVLNDIEDEELKRESFTIVLMGFKKTMKEHIVEFLFNDKKFTRTRNLLLVLYLVIVYLFVEKGLHEPLQIIKLSFLPLLTFVLVIFIVKIIWYNKIMNTRTRAMDWVATFSLFITLIISFFMLS